MGSQYPATDLSEESIRAELEKVLRSNIFLRAGRLTHFLRFTVEQVIKGKSDDLKEYILGIEVFARGQAYDPRFDSTVRVQAIRLRSKLKKYYETEGRQDAVIIEMPKGSYVPAFHKQQLNAPSAKRIGPARNSSQGLTPLVRNHTVGRKDELAEMRANFETAITSRGLLTGVAGEPGIGKSTLVEQFLAEVASDSRGCTIARGRCSERLAGVEAYLPFLEALQSLADGDSGESNARVVMNQVAPDWHLQIAWALADDAAGHYGGDIKAASQERLKRQLAVFFQELTKVRPCVLFLDDFHWADASTVDLVAYLATQFELLPMVIVIAYRPSDLALSRHPFLQIKADLQSRGLFHEIPLPFLTREHIENYIALEFPGNCFPAEFAALIHEKTEGNSLFVVDLLRYLHHRGTISSTRVGWALAQSLPDVARELPESVRSLIQRKIDQLSEIDRALLTAAAVQGNEFDSAVLAKVRSMDAIEVEERLEGLDRIHAFARLSGEGELPDGTLTLRYRFVHVLYQNALYAALVPSRKISLSAAVAEVILGYYEAQNSLVASELALLFQAARDFSRASHFFLLAAEHAHRFAANQEAVVLARRGLELMKTLPDTTERAQRELMLQVTLGASLTLIKGGCTPEAQSAYIRAQELCERLGDQRQAFLVLAGLCTFYLLGPMLRTSLDTARQLMQLAGNIGDPTLVGVAHMKVGDALQRFGEFSIAREHLDEAISLYSPHESHPHTLFSTSDTRIEARFISARVLWCLGYPDQAVDRIGKAVKLAQDLGNPHNVAMALAYGAGVRQLRREPMLTLQWAEKASAFCSEQGFPKGLAWSRIFYGWAIVRLHQDTEGLSEIRDSLASLRAAGWSGNRPHFLGLLAEALDEVGLTGEGLSMLAEALAEARSSGELYYEAELYRLKGELLVRSEQRWAEAETCFLQAIDTARRQQAKSFELRSAVSLTHLWTIQGKKEEGRKILEPIHAWFTEGFDTPDLKEAKVLLGESASAGADPSG